MIFGGFSQKIFRRLQTATKIDTEFLQIVNFFADL